MPLCSWTQIALSQKLWRKVMGCEVPETPPFYLPLPSYFYGSRGA